MIGYVTVGTNNLDRAVAFYDELFALLGAGRFMEEDSFVAWAASADSPGFAATKPFDGNPATVGNGTMVALAVDSKEKVHSVYDKAIELGGTDEGAPGPRGEFFYAGYFRDLDGNKLNVFWATMNNGD
jgi:catechol 2,3-dioxygenase-like lactoylglutathione lyase family enzyme